MKSFKRLHLGYLNPNFLEAFRPSKERLRIWFFVRRNFWLWKSGDGSEKVADLDFLCAFHSSAFRETSVILF